MSPWAERALFRATGNREAEQTVRASRLTGLVGRSAAGPWVANAPGIRAEGRDIIAVINEAAGEMIVEGRKDV